MKPFFLNRNIKSQTAVEYLLLLTVVAVIVFAAFKSLIPRAQSISGQYYNKVAIGIMGDAPDRFSVPLGPPMTTIYYEVRNGSGTVIRSGNVTLIDEATGWVVGACCATCGCSGPPNCILKVGLWLFYTGKRVNTSATAWFCIWNIDLRSQASGIYYVWWWYNGVKRTYELGLIN